MRNIAILASGSGSNAEKFLEFFKESGRARIAVVITNNAKASVIDRADRWGIPCEWIPRRKWTDEKYVIPRFEKYGVDFIVLAGFLQMVPEYLINEFGPEMVNIHPALLPSYGGKGIYGMHVHRAVWKNREKETGITIHRVNAVYDDGEIIFQVKCEVEKGDTPEDIQRKVQALEHLYFPRVVNYLLGDSS